MVKKIILVPIIILLGLLLTWFFAGLAAWALENREWFESLGPWGISGGFVLSTVSIVMAILSFCLGVAVSLGLVINR